MTKMAKVYFDVYGCTLNQADADIMKAIVKKKYKITKKPSDADVTVFVTCTVKGSTENKIMEKIKRTKKPHVIAGCLYVNEERIRRELKNPVVLGPYAISRINDAVEAALAKKEVWMTEDSDADITAREYTKPILRIQIQQGCVGNCFFCQTKLARKYLKSYRPKILRLWMEEGIKRGAREIDITGMDSGAYGLDIGLTLPQLLSELLSIKGDYRIRLGMINPQHLNRFGDEIIRLMKNKKFYKFIHMPVQSGSEKVCKEMNRPHTVADFKRWAKKFRKEIPDVTIATDIIVGYPTETKKDFEMTLKLLREVKPDVVNLSKFTLRPGTKAVLFKQLPTEEIKRRSEIAAEIIKNIATEKNKKLIGKKMNVLITEKGKGKTMKGRTDNYKQVVVSGRCKLGDFVKVKIKDANHGSLFGEVIG